MSDHHENIVDHSARKHSLLSPSGASRWMVCTVSPRLEEGITEANSPFAEEGTLAHEFGELGVRLITNDITQKQYDKKTAPFRKHPLYYPEMEDEVQIYVDYVYGQLLQARKRDKDAVLLIEQRVDLTHLIEEIGSGGMCDTIIVACGEMEVIDLKFGKGLRVYAEENKQLQLYGLGALYHYELAYDIQNVKLTIVQPRLDSISSWDIGADELRDFGQDEVVPKAKLAYAGEGEQVAGDHCRFCKVKGSCRAFAVKQLEAMKADFSPENICDVKFENKDHLLLREEEILAVYKVRGNIEEFVNAISAHVLSEALDGRQWPGFKLVEGRSNRAWLDASKVEEVLKKAKYDESKFMSEPKLLGIGAIEKLVGKTKFDSVVGEFVIKPQGKPTLVEESDKRPPFKKGDASDFGEVGNEEL